MPTTLKLIICFFMTTKKGDNNLSPKIIFIKNKKP